MMKWSSDDSGIAIIGLVCSTFLVCSTTSTLDIVPRFALNKLSVVIFGLAIFAQFCRVIVRQLVVVVVVAPPGFAIQYNYALDYHCYWLINSIW